MNGESVKSLDGAAKFSGAEAVVPAEKVESLKDALVQNLSMLLKEDRPSHRGKMRNAFMSDLHLLQGDKSENTKITRVYCEMYAADDFYEAKRLHKETGGSFSKIVFQAKSGKSVTVAAYLDRIQHHYNLTSSKAARGKWESLAEQEPSFEPDKAYFDLNGGVDYRIAKITHQNEGGSFDDAVFEVVGGWEVPVRKYIQKIKSVYKLESYTAAKQYWHKICFEAV